MFYWLEFQLGLVEFWAEIAFLCWFLGLFFVKQEIGTKHWARA